MVKVLFPRTDFPQQGWIRKPTVNGTTTDFYEALTDFGWYAQTQTPRANEQKARYGPRRQRVQQFYTDFQQWGWIRKPTVNGTTTDFYEALTDYGVFPETQSFRSAWPGRRNNRDKRGILAWLDKPQDTWLNPNLYDLGIRNAAIETGRAFSYRTPRRKYIAPLCKWEQDASWLFNVLSVYDSATWPAIEQLKSHRQGRERGKINVRTDFPESTWLNPDIYDLDVRWAAIEQLKSWRQGRELRRIEVRTDFPQPIFNPDTLDVDIRGPALEQLTKYYGPFPTIRKFTRPDYPRIDWLEQQVEAIVGQWMPASFQLAQTSRFAKPSSRLSVDPQDIAWVFQNLPGLYDASLFPSWQQLAFSIRAKDRKRDVRDLLSVQESAWIFQNLPLFDPSLIQWTIPDVRMPKKLGRSALWNFDNDFGWVTQNIPLFDFALVNWAIPDVRMPKSLGRPAWWTFDQDFGWVTQNIPIFDPSLQTWFFCDGRMSKILGRPVWYIFDQDFGWVTSNLPPVVPPSTVFYQGDGKRRRKRKKKPYDTQVLFDAIEATLREIVAGTPPTTQVALSTHAPLAHAIDISKGYEKVLDQLAMVAQENRDLSFRLVRLRKEIAAYEAKWRDEDEEDIIWLIL